MKTEELHRKEEKRDSHERNREGKVDKLVDQGEWERLGEDPEFLDMSVESRIITTRRAVGNAIKNLEEPFYDQVRTDPSGAEVILGKIKHLRFVRTSLGQELVKNIKNQIVPKTPVKKAA
ncbi:MAG: hypothetical protein ACD_50C00023G0003 [uncultured bacterium]|nr:MAG: hypothetical protein ACD_50C00023G0003 [uncultured bacterium]OGH14169.1 MAG: hypothetical protein A2687_03490 [Candidatus Levybacteria bacterium RIFCSPHIGHO2_01_FULL_38_26]